MAGLNDGKIAATVVSTHGSYVLADDADGTRYFILYNAIERTGAYDFEYLEFGAKVRLTPIAHPKGWRGIDVEIVEL